RSIALYAPYPSGPSAHTYSAAFALQAGVAAAAATGSPARRVRRATVERERRPRGSGLMCPTSAPSRNLWTRSLVVTRSWPAFPHPGDTTDFPMLRPLAL